MREYLVQIYRDGVFRIGDEFEVKAPEPREDDSGWLEHLLMAVQGELYHNYRDVWDFLWDQGEADAGRNGLPEWTEGVDPVKGTYYTILRYEDSGDAHRDVGVDVWADWR